ncbi:MAG: phospho-N-acetylmuramoyl-pentapeptide-transferase, partial [Brevinema sp.]
IHLTRSELGMGGNVVRSEKTNFIVPYRSKLFQAQFIPYYAKVLWYVPAIIMLLFYIFLIVGFSNATNLSDGLDGLATGMGISFFIPFGVFAYLMGNIVTANYLLLPYINGIGELSVFVAAVLGGMGAFLWYNVHPASVFMGDTGSLPMGASVAVVAILLKQELLLPIAGFMFVLETVSVILQVGSFKLRKGKRIFKMAPIHHHFEKSGWAENQVVVRFWILGVFFALLALASLKIR